MTDACTADARTDGSMGGFEDRLGPFTAERSRLRALAYRLLGSVSEAEDVVQDAWLRWSAVDPAGVGSAARFLTTMVTRLALDRLRSARYARERYYGLWLPEPLVAVDPDSPASEGEDMSMGMLLMLERLSPDQRAVFVLREAMDLDYAEIAAILGKTADSCRQTMRRAREQLGRAPRFAVDPAVAKELARSFARASLQRDYAGLVALMTEDVVLLGDGGGKARTALNPIRGADRIARFLIGIQRKHGQPLRLTPVRVNGGPGFLFHLGTRFHAVMAVDFAGGCIRRLYQVANPDKLRHLAG